MCMNSYWPGSGMWPTSSRFPQTALDNSTLLSPDSYGGEKFSECPSPRYIVGRMTGDGTWWSYGRKAWLFLNRMQLQGKTDGSFTSDWLLKWDTQSRAVNTPHPGLIPAALKYICEYVMNNAYARSRLNTESEKAYKTFFTPQ